MFLDNASAEECRLSSDSDRSGISDIKDGDVFDIDSNRHFGGGLRLVLSGKMRLGNGWINLQADRMEEEFKWATDDSGGEISKWHYLQVRSVRKHADGEKTFYRKWLDARDSS
jgi:hypothetical protein